MSTEKLLSTRSSQHHDLFNRVSTNPLISPSDITPSAPQLEIVGVLNPTFIQSDGIRLLVVRVDERPRGHIETEKHSGQTDVERTELLIFDSFTSHLRIADLDGLRVKVRATPIAFPEEPFSHYGCEDPRATLLEGQPVLTYTAVSRLGATAWFSRMDSNGVLRDKTMLQGPDHKHAALFPEKVGNFYFMVSRPLTRMHLRSSGVWIFRSPDLIHWGKPSPLLLPRAGKWDSVRVGPSTSPVLIAPGWLIFYYGVDSENSYHVGAALLGPENPSKVIARTDEPILSPIYDWERNGRRADTVFPCGLELIDKLNSIRLYYGAADTYVGAAEIEMSTLLGALLPA